MSGFDLYDICGTMDGNSLGHRFVDETRPLRPIFYRAGALDTNEKTAISLCKLRHVSEQIFYGALFAKQGFGIGAHVLIACHAIRP